MNSNKDKIQGKTLSGMDERALNSKFMDDAILLEKNLIGRYHDLSDKAIMNNIKETLEYLIHKEEEDMGLMERIKESGGDAGHLLRDEEKKKDLEMFDHKINEHIGDVNEVNAWSMHAVLLYALKETNDMLGVFSIAQEEYDNSTGKLFTALYNSKLSIKEKLESFLDSYQV